MNRSFLTCLLLLGCLGTPSLSQNQPWLPRLLHAIFIPGMLPAFMELHQDENPVNPVDSLTMYISSFNPAALFQPDPVYALRSPGRYLYDPEGLVNAFISSDEGNIWPNNPDRLPSSVVGREGIIWTSGFLVPGKQAGKLNMYFLDQGEDFWSNPVNIASQDEREWSYHRVVYKDMDKDGDLDVVTARFNVNLIGITRTDFSWLENPGVGAVGGWDQHMLVNVTGPDVHFKEMLLPGGYEVFAAGQFWSREVRVWYIEGNDWGADDASTRVQSVLLDNPGQIFDVYVDDVNRDGRPDLIATSYNVSGGEGFVYVYEVPDNWMTDPWPRHTIADGFIPNVIIGNTFMSPGTPKPFYPSAEYEASVGPDGRQLKPYISVSGDDDGRLYILTPDFEDADNWSYTKNEIVNTGGITSGKMAIGDMDNDGYTDIIGAGYTASRLFVFTYAP